MILFQSAMLGLLLKGFKWMSEKIFLCCHVFCHKGAKTLRNPNVLGYLLQSEFVAPAGFRDKKPFLCALVVPFSAMQL
jgi:hypothetical protein